MKQLLIVYHSQSGACAKLAQAALGGAKLEADLECRALRACDAGVAELAAADGLLLVAAENSAALSGGMKDFLDRVFYPAIEAGVVLPYALIVSAGNDGRGAVAQVQRILRGIPLTEATEPVILRGEVTEQHLRECAQLGQAVAAGLVMGIF